uniref:Uncharacterized protein n=1 Tax=Tanacetum cinerariifolium TaxID=118510 RepID=A0A6L2LZG5_TANCI|nr:hypothetical protein [Tanacetum cinerariifolium]
MFKIFHQQHYVIEINIKIKFKGVKDTPQFGRGFSKKSKGSGSDYPRNNVEKASVAKNKDKADVVKDKPTNVVRDKAHVVKAAVAKGKDKANVVNVPVAKDKENAHVVKAPVAKDKDKDKALVAMDKDKDFFI